MFGITTLPAVNAALNSIAAVLLTSGYVLVRRGRVAQHRLCMLAAFTTSALFLVSYLVYHAQSVHDRSPGRARFGSSTSPCSSRTSAWRSSSCRWRL